MASKNWKGYVWNLRNGGIGSPGFGGWSENNVTGPDGSDYLTLKITNPLGNAPIGAEMWSQKQGWGYGTYILTVGSRLDNIHKNIVFGGLFPIFIGTPYIEFDVCEISHWDTGFVESRISHNMWYGNSGNPAVVSDNFLMPSHPVHTHRLIWSPGEVVFDSFVGESVNGVNFFHTEFTENIPLPGSEVVVINLWVYAFGIPTDSDTNIPATNVVLRNFSFQSCPI